MAESYETGAGQSQQQTVGSIDELLRRFEQQIRTIYIGQQHPNLHVWVGRSGNTYSFRVDPEPYQPKEAGDAKPKDDPFSNEVFGESRQYPGSYGAISNPAGSFNCPYCAKRVRVEVEG